MNIGRNIKEIKRSIVALQTSKENNVLIPVKWNAGEDVPMPTIPYTEAEMKKNPVLQSRYYKVGVKMYYKKGEENQTHHKYATSKRKMVDNNL